MTSSGKDEVVDVVCDRFNGPAGGCGKVLVCARRPTAPSKTHNKPAASSADRRNLHCPLDIVPPLRIEPGRAPPPRCGLWSSVKYSTTPGDHKRNRIGTEYRPVPRTPAIFSGERVVSFP